MNHGKYVFAQIMDRLPWRRFQTCVDRYHGDHNIQTFKCCDYFRVMAFAQLTYRESLRDIVACLNAVPEKMYHLGIRSGISRNNLSNATAKLMKLRQTKTLRTLYRQSHSSNTI